MRLSRHLLTFVGRKLNHKICYMIKYFTLNLVAVLCALTSISATAQCPTSTTQLPSATLTANTNWQIADTNLVGGSYSLYNVTAGMVYEWSMCVTDGAVSNFDSELTLYNNADLSTALLYGDDECGSDAKITYTAGFTGVVRIELSEYNCQSNTTAVTLVYRTLGLAPAAPANDNCAGAIALPVNSNCVPTSGTVTNATLSLPACAGAANNDVWYKFVATAPDAVVTVAGSTDFDAVVEVFGGNCANLISLDCIDDTYEGETEVVNLVGLQVGNEYLIRVHDYSATTPLSTTFDICVTSSISSVNQIGVAEIKIYPNPVHDHLRIGGLNPSVDLISLYDMYGHLLFGIDRGGIAGLELLEVNTQDLAKGLYLIEILTNHSKSTKPFVKM